ncbi:MAG: hypothetical protein WC758_07635 [Candidatus Woesearchaeota archaeon]|jgi:hypothetical protein
MKVTLICGWCHNTFETENQKIKEDYPVRSCPFCGRTVSGSKKESTGKVVGRKHSHSDSRTGEVV